MSVEDPGPVDLTLLLQGLAGTYLRNPSDLMVAVPAARVPPIPDSPSVSNADGSTATGCPISQDS